MPAWLVLAMADELHYIAELNEEELDEAVNIQRMRAAELEVAA